MPENVIAVFLGQVQIEQDQSRAGCVRICIGGIEELRSGVAVGNEVQFRIDLGPRESFPDQKHIRFAVLDHEDLRNQSLAFIEEG